MLSVVYKVLAGGKLVKPMGIECVVAVCPSSNCISTAVSPPLHVFVVLLVVVAIVLVTV